MAQSNNLQLSRFGPAVATLLIAGVVLALAVLVVDGNPLGLARLEIALQEGDPIAAEPYDGQFVYYIAACPAPQTVRPLLDVPAYRYQRILLPLLARLLAFGRIDWIPWTIPLIGLISLSGGTWAVSELLAWWDIRRRYALVYGLWAGFMLALVTDLPEPLSYGLAVGGLLALERKQRLTGWLLISLAVFAKETAALFVAALMLSALLERRWRDIAGLSVIAVLPFGLFQGWLWLTFGQFGIGSGGAMSTSFEIIPFMGLLRIGAVSGTYLLAMLVVFGPTVVLSAVWGLWQSVRSVLKGDKMWVVIVLLVQALVILFTPYSTFRETGGITRFASGLMIGVLLFAARYQHKRVLNYSLFWVVLNVFLLK